MERGASMQSEQRASHTVSRYGKYGIAAVAMIAVIALGPAACATAPTPTITSSPLTSQPSAATTPSKTTSPSQSPAASEEPASTEIPSSPAPRIASAFRQPFAYALPDGLGWEAVPSSSDAYAEFRIPDSAPNGSAVGVILRAIDGGRVDPCATSSERRLLVGGPEAVIEYLDEVPRVELSGQHQTIIDGMSAHVAFVRTAEATPECPVLRPFARQDGVEEDEVITQAPPEVGIRVHVLEVGGEHVVIWTWANTPAWYAVAHDLIASFDFRADPALFGASQPWPGALRAEPTGEAPIVLGSELGSSVFTDARRDGQPGRVPIVDIVRLENCLAMLWRRHLRVLRHRRRG